jgi:hypothetical protein
MSQTDRRIATLSIIASVVIGLLLAAPLGSGAVPAERSGSLFDQPTRQRLHRSTRLA